ncbi:hypothetical protein N0V92_003098 [Colletotrichum tropicale]|nr:hypothetical protein N0V92_003098 [Colletotrichum tropicale]
MDTGSIAANNDGIDQARRDQLIKLTAQDADDATYSERHCREKDRFEEAEAMFTRTLESKKSDLALLNEKITAFQNDLPSSDLVVDNIELPAEATVDFESSRAEDFRARVMDAHGQDESDHAWCIITGRTLFDVTTAAHIIDRNVGDVIINVICGEPETAFGHVNSSGNGLMMAWWHKKAWDNAEFVIVRVDDDANEFQVIILHEHAQSLFEVCDPGQRLNGRRLKFHSDFRPDKKYLYFRLLTTLLQRHRFKVPDAVFDRAKLDQAARALWAGPGFYLEASALYKMSCQVGNLTEAAAMQLWGLERPPAELDEEQERVTSAMASKIVADTVDVFHALAQRSVCSQCNRPFDDNSLDDDGK